MSAIAMYVALNGHLELVREAAGYGPRILKGILLNSEVIPLDSVHRPAVEAATDEDLHAIAAALENISIA